MLNNKYQWTDDMGCILGHGDGSAAERTCRRMVLAGVEWLEREREGYPDPLPEAVAELPEGTLEQQLYISQVFRLTEDASGARVKTNDLLAYIKRDEIYKVSDDTEGFCMQLITLVAQVGWDEFCVRMKKRNKDLSAGSN